MQLKQFLTDDRAVSPVIGVILMVAITVILAAVIGTFVLGLGEDIGNDAPQASMDFDYDTSNTNVNVTHQGGDTITSDNTQELQYTDGEGNNTTASSFSYTAGDEIFSESYAPGSTVRVVWVSPDGSSSSTIAESQAPS